MKNLIKKTIHLFFFGRPIKGEILPEPSFKNVYPSADITSQNDWILHTTSKNYNQWQSHIRLQLK